MRVLLTALGLTAAVLASPAAALVTYDAFASFNGTNTGGAFTYGVFDGLGFTPYSDAAGCATRISNTICTSNGDLPAAFKSTSGPHQSGTVIVPGDALILHPGANAGETSAVVFTAPTLSNYRLSLSAFVADTNPSGVDLLVFIPGLGGGNFATLDATNPTFTTAGTIGYLPAGFQIGFAVDYQGVYNNDSTGFNFTMTAIPEPAAWTLMIAGFAMTGVAVRRRVALAA